MLKSNLEGWVFTYNDHTKKWYGAKRDDYGLLFSGAHDPKNKGKVLKSSSMDTLTWIISKTNGDTNKINKLIKN